MRHTGAVSMTAEQVAEHLRRLVQTGEYRPGHQLPTRAVVGKGLGAAAQTVQTAFNILAAEGLVTSRRGAGYFVRHPPTTVSMRELNSGFDRLIHEDVVPPAWVADLLGTPRDKHVHRRHQALDDRLFTAWRRSPGNRQMPKARRATTSLTAHAAAPDECELLGLRQGTPVLGIVHIQRDARGGVLQVQRVTALGAAYVVELDNGTDVDPDHD